MSEGNQQIKVGMRVKDRWGSAVGKVVGFRNPKLATVFWSGKDTDGKFNGGRGGYDALVSNLVPLDN